MSQWGEFGHYGDKVVLTAEWEKIRLELCGPTRDWKEDCIQVFSDGGPGGIFVGEGFKSQKEADDAKLFSELCWYVNNGPGYCEDAPPAVKVLLRRLKLI